MVSRKSLAAQRPPRPREPRKMSVPFAKYSGLPSAVVDGKFLATMGARVYVWRTRAGSKPSWHTCEVLKATPNLVELFDNTLGQCFGFDPTAPDAPDVRTEAPVDVPDRVTVVPDGGSGA